jgi:hypothetical protein
MLTQHRWNSLSELDAREWPDDPTNIREDQSDRPYRFLIVRQSETNETFPNISHRVRLAHLDVLPP